MGSLGTVSGPWVPCAGRAGACPRTSHRRRPCFVEVVKEPRILGQNVRPVAPTNMWQAQHAAAMCKALQGHATALPRGPATGRPAASLEMLHGGPRAWCSVIVALEAHSSALRMYDRGETTELTVRPANLEAPQLGALSGDRGTAMYLRGTVVGSAAVRFRKQYGGDAFRLVMAENMARWLRAFSTSRWKIEGDRERFADAWRRWVGGGGSSLRRECCTCRSGQMCRRSG